MYPVRHWRHLDKCSKGAVSRASERRRKSEGANLLWMGERGRSGPTGKEGGRWGSSMGQKFGVLPWSDGRGLRRGEVRGVQALGTNGRQEHNAGLKKPLQLAPRALLRYHIIRIRSLCGIGRTPLNCKAAQPLLPDSPKMNCRHCKAHDSVVLSGLNQTGLITFVVLLLVCFPLAFIPFINDGMKKKTCQECGREIT